jgi:hypothetical protein
MPTQWSDLLIRKALDDSGKVPYQGGTWTNSPDIIPTGTQVVANPAQAFGASTYNQDLGKPTVQYQPNYFYVRAKNLSSGAQTGQIYLYYCPQNLFLFPSLWTSNQLKTSSGKDNVAVSAAKNGDVAVVGEPFTFLPTSDVHSCLIARVTTPTNPNPLPNDGDFQDFNALGQYVMNHPNVGWRNVVLVSANIPTFTNYFTIDTTPMAPNSNGLFLIGISYSNLTVGSQLAFSAGTPIPSGPDAGKVIQLVQTAVTQSDGSLGTSYLTIPAGWKTQVSFSYWAQTPIRAGWKVQFYAILVTDGTSPLFEHASPIHQLGVAGLDEKHPLLAATGGISRGIRIGDVSVVGQSS